MLSTKKGGIVAVIIHPDIPIIIEAYHIMIIGVGVRHWSRLRAGFSSIVSSWCSPSRVSMKYHSVDVGHSISRFL